MVDLPEVQAARNAVPPVIAGECALDLVFAIQNDRDRSLFFESNSKSRSFAVVGQSLGRNDLRRVVPGEMAEVPQDLCKLHVRPVPCGCAGGVYPEGLGSHESHAPS